MQHGGNKTIVNRHGGSTEGRNQQKARNIGFVGELGEAGTNKSKVFVNLLVAAKGGSPTKRKKEIFVGCLFWVAHQQMNEIREIVGK